MNPIALAIAPGADKPTAPRRDLKTLIAFIDLYCRDHHPSAIRQAPTLRDIDVQQIAGKPITVCEDCNRLLCHALVKRTHCRMSPKPQCKHCPNHCYHPKYRLAIQEVMRYSGRKIMLHGRVDYLLHLLF
jgi:Nitrous oxide-stimulated promoter